MDTYPYPPFRATSEKIVIYLLFAGWVFLLAFYKKDSVLLWLVGTQWCFQIASDIRSYWQRKRSWLAKADDEFIYLCRPGNKFPKCDIGSIERQIVGGHKSGINIVYKNGHVRSEQFPILNEQQIDELVQFLKCAIPAR